MGIKVKRKRKKLKRGEGIPWRSEGELCRKKKTITFSWGKEDGN